MGNSQEAHYVEDSEFLDVFQLSPQALEAEEFGEDEHFEFVAGQGREGNNHPVEAAVKGDAQPLLELVVPRQLEGLNQQSEDVESCDDEKRDDEEGFEVAIGWLIEFEDGEGKARHLDYPVQRVCYPNYVGVPVLELAHEAGDEDNASSYSEGEGEDAD